MKAFCRLCASLWLAGGLAFGLVPARAQTGQNLDIVLVIDNSGSMSGNDPDGLRWSAAQLFVDLANSGDRIAALIFADGVQPLGSAVDGRFTVVQDGASREALKRDLAPRNPAGATNMEAALRAALELLRNHAGGNKPVIVFLTDGRPEPDSQRPALTALITQAGHEGVAIFPILLGASTDTQVAEQMVHDTGGLRQDIPSASELLRAFGKIYTFIRPERYADELSLATFGVNFRTNPAQAITQMSVVIARSDATYPAIASLTLGGVEILGRSALDNGAQVTWAEARHYQLVTVAHNTPIMGEWSVATSAASRGSGLLIANSAVTLDLIQPLPSVPGSFVAPRIVPLDKAAPLVARVLQNGNELGDVPLAVTTGGGQILPLNASGLSTNHNLYWRFLELGSLSANRQQRIEVQVGAELSPFRLRKEFVIEAAAVPPIIVDSPSASDSGLIASGKLRIAAHFEGGTVSDPTMTAYVSDLDANEVVALSLACAGNACEDATFTPEPGRSYHIVVLGSANYQGRPFSSGAETDLVTGDLIRIDGLDALGRLGPLAPGSGLAPIALSVTAFMQSGPPQLAAQLTDLRPLPAGLSADALGVTLSALAATGGKTYSAELSFRGFDRLPPGDYAATLVLSSLGVTVQPSAVPFQFKVAQPEARLSGLPNPLAFGVIPDLRRPQIITVEVTFGQSAPFDLIAVITSLYSTSGPENPDIIQLDLGRLTGGPDRFAIPMRLSALRPLRPGEYRGMLQFKPANPNHPAKVEPSEATFVFSIPQPVLALERVSLANDPVGCPELEHERLPADLVDFGAFRWTTQPARVDLFFKGDWIQSLPDVDVAITSLHQVQGPDALTTPVRLSSGTVQRGPNGLYILPLILELPPSQSPGAYVGTLSLTGPGIRVQPDKLRFAFNVSTTLWGRLRQWVRPGYCAMVDWYTLTPFPRPKGLLAWALTAIVTVIVGATISRVRSAATCGLVQPTSGEPGGHFGIGHPIYILRSETGLRLSRLAQNAGQALVEVVAEEGDEEEVALVRPGAGLSIERLSYWNTRKAKWFKLPVAGKRLRHLDRFSIRSGGRRHEFTIMFDRGG